MLQVLQVLREVELSDTTQNTKTAKVGNGVGMREGQCWRFLFTKNFWEFRSEISVRSKGVPFVLLHHLLSLSVVRANHSDITYQHVHNLKFETTVYLWCVLSLLFFIIAFNDCY